MKSPLTLFVQSIILASDANAAVILRYPTTLTILTGFTLLFRLHNITYRIVDPVSSTQVAPFHSVAALFRDQQTALASESHKPNRQHKTVVAATANMLMLYCTK